MSALTIIVPVYNEEESLNRLFNTLEAYTLKASMPTQVLFVNDGSKDNSLNLIKAASVNTRQFNYISLNTNSGLSAAIKAGIDTITTPLIGYIDADLQTQPNDFEKLIPFISENGLVTGYRTNRQDSFTKQISSKIANTIRCWFTKDGMTDTGCPLKIIHSSVAKKIPFFKGSHRFLPALVLLQKESVTQVAIPHYKREEGVSKFNFKNRLFSPLLFCFIYLWIKAKHINYSISEIG